MSMIVNLEDFAYFNLLLWHGLAFDVWFGSSHFYAIGTCFPASLDSVSWAPCLNFALGHSSSLLLSVATVFSSDAGSVRKDIHTATALWIARTFSRCSTLFAVSLRTARTLPYYIFISSFFPINAWTVGKILSHVWRKIFIVSSGLWCASPGGMSFAAPAWKRRRCWFSTIVTRNFHFRLLVSKSRLSSVRGTISPEICCPRFCSATSTSVWLPIYFCQASFGSIWPVQCEGPQIQNGQI